jgi:hypothetical protein
MARCPFIDPEFDIDVDEPCPICGMTGYAGQETDKCVGDVVDTSDELHQILGEALASAERS